MQLPIEIFSGDSTPIILVRPNIADNAATIDADWSCSVALFGPTGKQIVAPKAVTAKSADSMYFSVQLSPDDTAAVNVVALPVECKMVVQVKNLMLSPNYSRETAVILRVAKGMVA